MTTRRARPVPPGLLGVLVRVTRPVDYVADWAIATYTRHPWLWPAALALAGVGTVAVSLAFEPIAEERVLALGHEFGEPCGFYVTTGKPCPQCGMTRAWVWAARGHVVRSFFYNPAGAVLFWWIVLAGALGAARLATRNHKLAEVPASALLGLLITWVVGLYLVPWLARIGLDVNPLPTPWFLEGR